VPIDERAKLAMVPYLRAASLVVVDGVTEAMTMHNLDLNSNQDAAAFYHLLPRWIADLGPAVVLIDHVTKNAETRGRFAIGAQHKLAGLDGVSYTVEKIKGRPFGVGRTGAAKILVAKDRPGRVREHTPDGENIGTFWLESRDGLVIARIDAATGMSTTTTDGRTYDRPTQLMEKVSRFVEGNPRVSRTQIVEAKLGNRGEYVRKAIDALVTERFLAEIDIGRKDGRGYVSLNPFRLNGGALLKPDAWWTREPPEDDAV